MRSFIRELVRVAEVFFLMIVFCLALYSQLMRGETKKPVVPTETKKMAAAKTMGSISKQQEHYLFFEQFTR